MGSKLVKSIFVIVDTESGAFVKFGTKVAWVSQIAAKNAYTLHLGKNYWRKDDAHYDDQSRYKIVEINAKVKYE